MTPFILLALLKDNSFPEPPEGDLKPAKITEALKFPRIKLKEFPDLTLGITSYRIGESSHRFDDQPVLVPADFYQCIIR